MAFAQAAGAVPFGWTLGLIIGLVVVAVVVALVTPILVLAYKIGTQAQQIDEALGRARRHTAGLAGLRQTIDHATQIIGGLQRGRARLGG
jgi:NhaP-type Na+/H+ or K+/H+ antiporter